ncbi:MAG: 3-hydroxyacyl-CoA dehydrogenase family protein [Chlorobi bacterium]|nr:3-hydroxyacyl-CoA dehydrogenase family protein [Chlorobiota bacterium]
MIETIEDYALGKQVKKKGSLQKVGLIGCGNMGQEIAHLVAACGIEVMFIDLTLERIAEVFIELNQRLDDIIDKWGLTVSEKKAILSRVHGTIDYNDIKDCDLVIETINTRKPGTSIDFRKEVFRKIEAVVREDTIIASNTSTLVISDLASVLKHPERAVGIHFITPATTVGVMEVVRGMYTSEDALKFVEKFARTIDKKVVVLTESPGNISTRLIVTLINEACEVLMEGVATARNIDDTMKMGFGLQFGPLEMADRIGLDKVIKWMNNLYQEFGERKFKPNPILKRLYRLGKHGKRSGTGFYIYENGEITGESIACPEIFKD